MCFIVFFATFPLYHKANEEALVVYCDKTLRTFKNTSEMWKHEPAARVFYISFVSSNALRVLSQCNTRLHRLLYLLSDFSNGFPFIV